jgi:hypothetical protein
VIPLPCPTTNLVGLLPLLYHFPHMSSCTDDATLDHLISLWPYFLLILFPESLNQPHFFLDLNVAIYLRSFLRIPWYIIIYNIYYFGTLFYSCILFNQTIHILCSLNHQYILFILYMILDGVIYKLILKNISLMTLFLRTYSVKLITYSLFLKLYKITYVNKY